MLGKGRVNITQKANFPWDGKFEMIINPEKSSKFVMKIRIPGWAQNEAIPGGLYKFKDSNSEKVKLLVNGKDHDLTISNGYATISREWNPGDKIEVEFPMPVRKVIADERVKEDLNKIAYQRGPVIYCAEWPDNTAGDVLDLKINKDAVFSTEFDQSLLGGTQVIETSGSCTRKRPDGKTDNTKEVSVKLIPYALWNNRGPGQMKVWFPDVESVETGLRPVSTK
jgi:DUF1680 family protein